LFRWSGGGQGGLRPSGEPLRRPRSKEMYVRLMSGDGTVMDLRPLRFQFGPSPEPRDWDANWLDITGDVALSDGRSWSFTDPCLTTREARELRAWLQGVLAGTVNYLYSAAKRASTCWSSPNRTEPNLAFSLAGRDSHSATVRVHFSLESLPPWLRGNGNNERPEIFDFFIEVQLARSALMEAAASWGKELPAFPVR